MADNEKKRLSPTRPSTSGARTPRSTRALDGTTLRSGSSSAPESKSRLRRWEEVVAQGDTVVVLGEERSLVKPTGRAFENEWAHAYTLRDGKVAKGRFIEDTAAQVVAFEAAQNGGGTS